MRESHIRPHTVAILVAVGCQSTPSQPNLSISIDDGAPAGVEVTGPIALASVVPMPMPAWRAVHAETSDGRTLTLTTPATTYPGAEVRLYLDARRVALGVFSPVTPDMPEHVAKLALQPIESLVGIDKVQIVTRRRELPSLVVEVDGRPITLGTSQLQDLPIVNAGRRGSDGWSVLDVIARIDPKRTWRSIRVFGDDITIDVEAGSSNRYLLKANQRGDYVFRVWEPGGKTPTKELRKLTKIALD